MAYIENGTCELVSRKNIVYKSFARLASTIAKLPVKNAILDGELVCLDNDGRSIFLDLGRRRLDACFYAFDLLWIDGVDLRGHDERENGQQKWWWELWRFLLALEFGQIIEPGFNVVMVGGRAINAETLNDADGQPSWISLPAMMKMRISTPHYLEQMKGKATPFGFVLHPRTRDKLKLTLLTPFSKNRAGWAHCVCINTHDGKTYRLDELSPADIVTLGDILCGYVQHHEIKSLGPDREKCKAYTRGLLRRMTINGGLQHCIGKEVSRFEQGKDDFIENIDDVCIHYDGGRVAANESLAEEISTRGLRKTTKETGLDRKTIRAILKGRKVKASTLAQVVKALRQE